MPDIEMFLYVTLLMLPVVPELDLILHPFSLFSMTEFWKVTPSTVLLLLPPTEPMERPWLP